MRASSFLAPLFFAASSLAQAVEEGIEPPSSAPAGCDRDVKGNFTIGVQNVFPSKSKRETAQQAAGGALLCTLEDGILRDQYSRTGSIVANRQFQFDGPPQAGAIYTGGFSVCQNNSLAIGGSTRWWRCMSGAFGNLYDESIGDQCTEIRIVVDQVDKPTPSSSVLPGGSIIGLSSSRAATATRSASVTSPSGASSAASNSMASSGSSVASASQSASNSVSTTGSASSSTSVPESSSSSSTASGAAPPASEGGAASFVVVPGAVFGALLTLGVVLVL